MLYIKNVLKTKYIYSKKIYLSIYLSIYLRTIQVNKLFSFIFLWVSPFMIAFSVVNNCYFEWMIKFSHTQKKHKKTLVTTHESKSVNKSFGWTDAKKKVTEIN